MTTLPNLSHALLATNTLASTPGHIPAAPPNILQFGEGNFLRGFVDWMVDVANERGVFSGRVAIAQPLPQGTAEKLAAQDCLYTVLLRGTRDGREIDEHRVVTCVREAIDPYVDWTRMLELARSASLRFVVSNTTEAGIVLAEEAYAPGAIPRSFPAQVAALLHARYLALGKSQAPGLVFLPCELIEANGATLRRIVLQHVERWELGAEFARWVERDNHFLNTLVDRIVPGYPAAEANALQTRLGYVDPLLVAAEPFHLWVIEGPQALADELPLHRAGLDVVWTDDLQPYRTRKVRILNGAHTASALAAYCCGLDTVRQMIDDPVVAQYLDRVMFDEIVPFVPLSDAERRSYAASIMERFGNRHISHELISIALNSVSKWKVRVLPTVRDYVRGHGRAPPGLAFSLAALLAFYRGRFDAQGGYIGVRFGQNYPIRDDAEVLAILDAGWRSFDPADHRPMVAALLSDVRLWGEDLSLLADLSAQVSLRLGRIETAGMKSALAELVAA